LSVICKLLCLKRRSNFNYRHTSEAIFPKPVRKRDAKKRPPARKEDSPGASNLDSSAAVDPAIPSLREDQGLRNCDGLDAYQYTYRSRDHW